MRATHHLSNKVSDNWPAKISKKLLSLLNVYNIKQKATKASFEYTQIIKNQNTMYLNNRGKASKLCKQKARIYIYLAQTKNRNCPTQKKNSYFFRRFWNRTGQF